MLIIVNGELITLTDAEAAAMFPAPTLADRISTRIAEINTERDRRLDEGAPHGGKRIEVTDRGRADLSGMMHAATLALQGLVPWSEGYSAGWICIDNARLPLPAPIDGIALGAAVGDWYGRTMQHARDLKNAVLAADSAGSLDAIDIAAGWPGQVI